MKKNIKSSFSFVEIKSSEKIQMIGKTKNDFIFFLTISHSRLEIERSSSNKKNSKFVKNKIKITQFLCKQRINFKPNKNVGHSHT